MLELLLFDVQSAASSSTLWKKSTKSVTHDSAQRLIGYRCLVWRTVTGMGSWMLTPALRKRSKRQTISATSFLACFFSDRFLRFTMLKAYERTGACVVWDAVLPGEGTVELHVPGTYIPPW